MGIRFAVAQALSAVSTWGLKHVFHRPAANFPGKIALYADPRLIGDLRGRVDRSLCVVGTNGKTTVTNLIADAFEADGLVVTCNRTGANLDSGVATALLHNPKADWGVFECDELWLTKILPFLQSDYVVLLNLFRDQLDRVGEIDHIQESIAGALERSPQTTLLYNADDPLCQAIADRVSNPRVAFGVAEALGLEQNLVADARMCQRCATMLEYHWRQYGQLGSYYCPCCGFKRPELDYAATAVDFQPEGTAFSVVGPDCDERVQTTLAGAYMVYNLLAVCVTAVKATVDFDAVAQAIRRFNPRNGRLQGYVIQGHPVLLNLAKNPTGFNQNLKIVMQGEGPKAVAFFINDKEADGRDVSWLWDIDFQELAADRDLVVFAGGIRRNDMQVRLKYAGVEAALVDGPEDFIAKAEAAVPEGRYYAIANYTALPTVKAGFDAMAAGEDGEDSRPFGASAMKPTSTGLGSKDQETVLSVPGQGRLVIAALYPTLLNLYGDSGNVIVLAERARRRGLAVEVRSVNQGDELDLSDVDIVFLGGGPDREQHLASEELNRGADALRAYVEDDGVVLAICGGFQILGHQWLMGEESVPGLGLVDLTTERREGGSHNRLVGDIALEVPFATHPVVGYENHAGRTYLGPEVVPFGKVKGSHGQGNNGQSGDDGVLFRNVIGTYLHGPLLAKNPEVADELLRRALERQSRREGADPVVLAPLDDSEEIEANAYMGERLGVR